MTGRIETMDFVAGIRLAELDEDIPIPVSPEELCHRLVDLTMKQVFTHGFFHGDPHPGNLRVLADGRLCYLDYGMMGFLDHRGRTAFGDLVYALGNQDEVAASHVLLRLAVSEHEPVREQLESDLAGFIHRHFAGGPTRLEFNRVLRDLVELMRNHGLHLPGGFLLMLKSLGQAESLVRELNPRHDLIQQATPYVRNLRMERMQPREILDGIYEFGREASELARELPVELRRMLDQLKNGRARIVFRHQGLEPLVEAGDRISNRLSFAVVLAALVIGSSVIVHAGLPPKWHDIPLIGLAGFVVAGVMAFWLLISILRHGRM
jgi:ubiquinone biosynthesis protein